MHFGRMFWVTALVAAVDAFVGFAASAGLITTEIAQWVIGGVTMIGGTHNIARGFEDGLTKKKPNGVKELTLNHREEK